MTVAVYYSPISGGDPKEQSVTIVCLKKFTAKALQ